MLMILFVVYLSSLLNGRLLLLGLVFVTLKTFLIKISLCVVLVRDIHLSLHIFQDWLQYSGTPGVCPAVMSCNATVAASTIPCVPQPPTDNGSCAEMASQCRLWVTQGLFQNEYCVLASFCYAWSNTDVLLLHEYPSYAQIPTSAQEERLSEAVFYNMTGGAASMTEQNAIDAYYSALVR